jgi:hypothetical protein
MSVKAKKEGKRKLQLKKVLRKKKRAVLVGNWAEKICPVY